MSISNYIDFDYTKGGRVTVELWLSGSIILEDVNKIDKLDIPGISGVLIRFI